VLLLPLVLLLPALPSPDWLAPAAFGIAKEGTNSFAATDGTHSFAVAFNFVAEDGAVLVLAELSPLVAAATACSAFCSDIIDSLLLW
jgi:hypothetical protein